MFDYKKDNDKSSKGESRRRKTDDNDGILKSSTEDIVKNISKLKKESGMDYASKYKDRINNDVEEKQLIKKMQEMEDKNDKRNNIIMIVTFVVIGIILLWILIKTFSTPIASLIGKSTNKPLDTNSKPITEKPVVEEPKKEVAENSIYTYCLAKENMDKVYNNSVAINNNDNKGITAIFIAEILRQNGIPVPTTVNNTKALAESLQVLGWQMYDKPDQMQKGDVVFTTHLSNMPGYPSHVYIFLNWVQEGVYTDAYICDSLREFNNGEWVHKRNVTYETENQQKMIFYMRPINNGGNK